MSREVHRAMRRPKEKSAAARRARSVDARPPAGEELAVCLVAALDFRRAMTLDIGAQDSSSSYRIAR